MKEFVIPSLDPTGIVIDCGACGQKNRLLYDRLWREIRCGRCKQPLTTPSVPIEVESEADFDHLIRSAAVPVVVDYWAPWCGPCRMVAPELVKVAARAGGRFIVVKVNTDALNELGQRLQIRSIPTLAMYSEGREVARTTGARPAAAIEAFIAQADAGRSPA
ncbi:MAG: thioredoxin [Acidobacteria bacterium]|nr:MAG: thioredoxin [Acidobacteriota bacterium]